MAVANARRERERAQRLAERERALGILWTSPVVAPLPPDPASAPPPSAVAVADVATPQISTRPVVDAGGVKVCADPAGHLASWSYRLEDRRFVCDRCHPFETPCPHCHTVAWRERSGQCGDGWYCATCH